MAKQSNQTPNWLFNLPNLGVLIVSFCLVGTWFYFNVSTNVLKKSDANVVKQINSEQNKLNKLVQNNAKTIYLPQAGDLQLSTTQRQSVEWLTNFFTQVTTYNNVTGYNTNYQAAKVSIHDSEFFKQFLTGSQDVNAFQLKSKNVRTQVLVTGPISYKVIVNYIPYHNDSDLYQQNTLSAAVKIFDVKGIPGNYQYARLDSNIITKNLQIPMSTLNQ